MPKKATIVSDDEKQAVRVDVEAEDGPRTDETWVRSQNWTEQEV